MNGKVHPGDRMTSRERLLAAYHGGEVDRLPFWAKVANSTWRLSQPKSVQAWSDRELLDYIGADGIFWLPACIRTIPPHATTEQNRRGNVRTIVTHTPDGDLAEHWTVDPMTESWHPTEFPVKAREDIRRYCWVYTDCRHEIDEAKLEQTEARARGIGERGITLTAWGTSPLMHLVQHVAGPVGTHYMLADHPGEMGELIALMHAANLGRVRLLAARTPADVVTSVENTSTTLINPGQFERYCLPHLCDYGRAIEAAGKAHELHMCGKTLVLLERIDTIPAAAIEAFTSPTLGNTRLADGRLKAPSKTLVGGTNVNVWLMPLEKIKRYIAAELDACPDHRRIVLTTAGVAPPACPYGPGVNKGRAETFRAVGQWIRTVPIRA